MKQSNCPSFLICLFLIFLTVTCKDKESSNNDFVPIRVIESIEQKFFFESVYCLTSFNDNIFFIDATSKSIFRCNDTLQLLNKISSIGRGPGELLYPFRLFVDADSIIFVLDSKIIKRFNFEGQYLGNIDIGNVSDGRFCKLGSKIVCSSVSYKDSTSIKLINTINKDFFSFGTLEYKSDNKSQNVAGNWKHVLLTSDGNILDVGIYYPSIALYDNNHINKKIKTINHQSFIDSYNYYESQLHIASNLTYSIVKDAYYYNNKLYILIYHKPNKDIRITCNTILVYNVQDDQIKFNKMIKLKDSENRISYISTFCVSERNELIAFDCYSSCFLVYDISNL